MTKPAVIFDFDGVLVDSFAVVCQMVKEAFAEIGMNIDDNTYRSFYFQNVKEGEKEFVADGKKFLDLQRLIRQKFPHAYKRVPLFPFTEKLIRKLGVLAKLGIVSSTPAELIEKKLAEKNLGQYFFEVITAGADLTKKEKLMSLSEELGTHSDKTFFVSDTVGDIREGNNLGLITAAVTWGFHDRSTLTKAAPDFLVDNPEDLIKCIKSI